MELYAKGQLSFLILTCMQDRDFYGLDIISEITERSNGRINLKKPSVYSNLTRMEKQGYISSYLRNSDFGPNRKYYSLTEKGREFYAELKGYFERNNIDVFKDFNDGESGSPTVKQQSIVEEETIVENTIIEDSVEKAAVLEKNEESVEEDGFFDFSFAADESAVSEESAEEEKDIQDEEVIEETAEEVAEENSEEQQESENYPAEMKIEEKQPIEENNNFPEQPTENYSIKQALLQKNEEKTEEKAVQETSGGVFLSQQSADEYNKHIYDISKDINKYRKKRSFAEDQISMGSTAPLASSQEKTKTNIEEFKNALLINKNKYQDQRYNKEDFDRHMNNRYDRPSIFENQVQEAKKEEVKNDAVFITSRLNAEDIEKARKIEPPQLKIISESSRETKLPAPKRDAAIDPSHKEILSQLYARTRDNSTDEVREDAIYDYNDLKDFYNNQNISFSIYKKPSVKLKHNTNKLYMVMSLLTFALAAVLSAAAFVTLYILNLLNSATNFLYILLPALLLVDVAWKIYKFKCSSGWLPNKIMPQWLVWLIYIVLSGAIVGINFACGVGVEMFALYATTLILPLLLTAVVVPIRYYIKRIAIVKYWR